MVGFLGGGRKCVPTSSQELVEDSEKFEDLPKKSSPAENAAKPRRIGLFGSRRQHPENEGGDGSDKDSSSSGGYSDQNSQDDNDTKDTGHRSARIVCETYPDGDNEFHEMIQNQNWDLLEILLKEYDYKKYAKPKEAIKKPPRKLRVAKYLPEINWRKNKDTEILLSPLYGLDALGRAPLHLCCVNPCPDKALMRLLFCARDVASVADETGSLPIHLAITHERSIEVVDKLIRGYYQGSWEPDGTGRTPLTWAIEVVRRLHEEKKTPSLNNTFWGSTSTREETEWQKRQILNWELVHFMLENRIVRRKKLLPREYRLIVQSLLLAATPEAISLFLDLGDQAMKRDTVAGPALSLCISRQYPLTLFEKLVEACPREFTKKHKDPMGRGVVAGHYRIGCISHHDEQDHKKESFRMTMQNLANAAGDLQEKVISNQAYDEWWEKLKFLINLWGSHSLEDDASHDDFNYDDLLLHNALSNPDVPPSLIRLLAALRPSSTDLEHPKSNALPLHIACRVWRYRNFPPRRGEKEVKLDKVVLQLMEGDYSRTRKRYRDRLPLHHAVAAGKNWMFTKPLVVHDRKTLHVRDPTTKLYPFQLAASKTIVFDMKMLTRHQFTSIEWNKMKDHEQDHKIRIIEHFYDLEQLTVIYELLRHSPGAIDHDNIARTEAERRAAGPKRKVIMEGLEATEEVAIVAQMKMIRGLFGLGNVSGHFIAWAYESTRRGWKTHRSNFGVLKEAIMDGFIPTAMDKWWRKLKFWIWQDCPWESPQIPHRDVFLLHGAMCNPDTSPWIIELLLECFPRSASIPLPGSDGCYPLHMACVTDRYMGLTFEFPNKRNIVDMTAKAFSDATLMKWKSRLPLHLAIVHSKNWDEIQFLADDEPVALAVADAKLGFFPFQLMALNRPYSTKQRKRFEAKARNEVGTDEWKKLSAHEKVMHMSKVLEEHEVGALGCIWELLKRNAALVSIPIVILEGSNPQVPSSSIVEKDHAMARAVGGGVGSNWMNSVGDNLSVASLDFLEEVYGKDSSRAKISKTKDKEAERSVGSLEGSMSDPFLNSSYRVGPRNENIRSTLQSRTPARNSNAPITEDASMEPEYEEHIIQDIDSIEPEDASNALMPVQYEYEEIDPNFNQPMTKQPRESRTQEDSRREVVANHALTKLKLGPYDHEELCFPRRKDILLICKSSAYVIWKNEVLMPGTLKASSKGSYWIKVLQQMGEQVDISDIHGIRHEEEQTLVTSVVVDGVTVYIDEDDNYVWLLCGEDAGSVVENYDIEAAMSVTSSLLDNETGVWLDAFRLARDQEGTSAKNNPHRILNLILAMTESAACESELRKFMITRTMLRSAFAHGTMNTTQAIAELIIEKSTRRLWFDIARQKLEVRIKRRGPICIRYHIAKRLNFERQRLKFSENQRKIRFLRKLKRRQRQVLKSTETGHIRPSGSADESLNVPVHSIEMHQTSTEIKDDNMSLDGVDLFDSPTGPLPEKPLLAAALKAKEEANKLRAEKEEQKYFHLDTLHQPKVEYYDNRSLNDIDLFDPPVGPPPEKPLVFAAIKAKAERDKAYLESSLHTSDILNVMNQPKISNEGDANSLGSIMDRSEEPSGPPPQKPLHTAALKAKKEAEGRSGAHLADTHQPSRLDDEVDPIGSSELFDEPIGPPPEKPLLVAALKARKKAGSRRGVHLIYMHQPNALDKDDDSLQSNDLFDPPRGPPPEKPMLNAALKAKQQQEQQVQKQAISQRQKTTRESRRERRRAKRYTASHLKGLHQLDTADEDDNTSSCSVELFDPPKGPPPRKPMVAAELKAKEHRDREEGKPKQIVILNPAPNYLHQEAHHPTTKGDEDEDRSLVIDVVFVPPSPPPPAKPLLAAALKAKEDSENGIFLSPSGTNSILKAGSYGNGSPADIPTDGSMTMADVFIGSPTQKSGAPRKEGTSKKPVPMTAKLVRMNSVQRRPLHNGTAVHSSIKSTKTTSERRSRRRPNASEKSMESSSNRRASSTREKDKGPPTKRRSGLMNYLGKKD